MLPPASWHLGVRMTPDESLFSEIGFISGPENDLPPLPHDDPPPEPYGDDDLEPVPEPPTCEQDAEPACEEPFALFGTDLLGDVVQQVKNGPLARRFEFPPFSVLSARDGTWQERKRAWLALGIKSELGRGAGMAPQPSDTAGSNGFARADLHAGYERDDNGGAKLPAATSLSSKVAPGGTGGCWIGGPQTASSHKYGSTPVAHGLRQGTAGDALFAVQGAQRADKATAAAFTTNHALADGTMLSTQTGTSIFDPVLTELCYRWFCPPGGQIIDPFAGGSVRGLVATLLGFKYGGCELSAPQVAANREQAAQISPDRPPKWVVGDALDILPRYQGVADFVFTCPPYGDLEVYSDDPRDLSTMSYAQFVVAYQTILKFAAATLKPDRFACIVVGDFRDKKTGNYRGFVADTINAAAVAGLALYNDAILLTAVGSLPVRTGKQFSAGRKLGKTHQNVLVFVKGDWRRAAAACNAGGDF